MNKTISHRLYYKYIIRKIPCIIYFYFPFAPCKNQVELIIEEMLKKYPRVPCYKVDWNKKYVDGFHITVNQPSDVISFKDGKQTSLVSSFEISELENLFKTVYNDCIKNCRSSYNKLLLRDSIFNSKVRKLLYKMDKPAYDIDNTNPYREYSRYANNFCMFRTKPISKYMNIISNDYKDSFSIATELKSLIKNNIESRILHSLHVNNDILAQNMNQIFNDKESFEDLKQKNPPSINSIYKYNKFNTSNLPLGSYVKSEYSKKKVSKSKVFRKPSYTSRKQSYYENNKTHYNKNYDIYSPSLKVMSEINPLKYNSQQNILYAPNTSSEMVNSDNLFDINERINKSPISPVESNPEYMQLNDNEYMYNIQQLPGCEENSNDIELWTLSK